MKRLFTYALVGMMAIAQAVAAPTMQKIDASGVKTDNIIKASAELKSNSIKKAEPTKLQAPANPQKATEQVGNVTLTTSNGIIYDVQGIEPKIYQRGETGTTYFIGDDYKLYYDYQSGAVKIIEDGNTVYMQNPLTRYNNGAWIMGTKSGDVISFATAQPLSYSSNYDATMSLRWGSAADFEVADDYSDVIEFAIDGNTLTLLGSTSPLADEGGYVIGLYWDDDDTYQGYWDAETVLSYDEEYVPASRELVELPAGAEVEPWYCNSYVDYYKKTKEWPVNVAFVGDEVYVQGLSEDLPDAWIKGTNEDGVITFDNFQYMGVAYGYEIWAVSYDGTDIVAPVAVYNETTKMISFTNQLIFNADEFKIYYLDYLADTNLMAESTYEVFQSASESEDDINDLATAYQQFIAATEVDFPGFLEVYADQIAAVYAQIEALSKALGEALMVFENTGNYPGVAAQTDEAKEAMNGLKAEKEKVLTAIIDAYEADEAHMNKIVTSYEEFINDVDTTFPGFQVANADKFAELTTMVNGLAAALAAAAEQAMETGVYVDITAQIVEAAEALMSLSGEMSAAMEAIDAAAKADYDKINALYELLEPIIEDETGKYDDDVFFDGMMLASSLLTLKEDIENAMLLAISDTGVYESPLSAEDLDQIEADIKKFVETAGINAISSDNSNAKYYDLNGREVKNPAKGQMIIKVANGTAKKVAM